MFHRVTSAPLSRSYVPRVPLTQAHKTRKKNKKSNRAFPIHCLAWSVQTKKAEYLDTHLKLSCIILESEVWFGLFAFLDHCGVKRNTNNFSFPLFASLKKSGKCDGRGRAIKTEIFLFASNATSWFRFYYIFGGKRNLCETGVLNAGSCIRTL